MGIEPTSEAWEASILPLNYARSGLERPQNSIALLRVQQDASAMQRLATSRRYLISV